MANDKKFVVKNGLSTPNVDFTSGANTLSAVYNANGTLTVSGPGTTQVDINGNLEVTNFNVTGQANVATNLQVTNAVFVGTSSVNSTIYTGTANNATYAFGKTEGVLNVNSAVYAANATYAADSNLLDGLDSTYFTNATNISTGTLNSLRLPNTAVTTGTYGNSSAVPVITIDQYGRITAATTNAISGVTAYSYTAANNTFTITTGTGAAFNATINSVQDFTVAGNLTVGGTTTTLNTNNLTVNDAIVVLNKGQTTPVNDVGFLFQRYSAANSTNYNVGLAWEEQGSRFVIGKSSDDGSNNNITFSTEWLSLTSTGRLGIGNTNPGHVFSVNGDGFVGGNLTVTGPTLTVGTATINSTIYTGTANNATYAFGKTEGVLNVNSAVYSTNASFAYTANNSTYAYGKTEGVLNVNSANYSTNASFAYTANNSTYAYGKTEGTLNVNSANYSTNATFAYTGNNANYLLGQTWAVPGTIGSTTPTTGRFTTLTTDTATANSFTVLSSGVYNGSTLTTTSVSQVVLASYAVATYGAAKLVIQAVLNSDRHITEMLIAANTTHAVATEYGQVYTSSAVLASYDCDISGGNVRVLVTPASANSTSFKVLQQLFIA